VQHAEEPRFDVAGFTEAGDLPAGADARFLNEIFCICLIAREPERGAE
jgi:hypothetical protein